MNELLLLTGMLVVTYSVRFLPFALAGRIVLPDWMLRSLSYVPICVLSAIIVPAIVAPAGSIHLSLQNSYLVAGVVAILISYLTRNLLATIFLGMTAFFLWRWLVL